MDTQNVIFNVVTTIIPLIMAIAVHEWAHVAMARFLGDRTGEAMGRLTLNPLAHIDPVWTVALPVFFVVMQSTSGGMAVPFFGAGRPAPYNPARLDRPIFGKRLSMRTAEMWVAAAGPLSNLALAIVVTLGAWLLVRFADVDISQQSVVTLLLQFVILNVGLLTFNLIPIPPLDGSKVLLAFLPTSLATKYLAVAHQLSFVLLAVLVMGGASFVLAPIQRVIISALFSIF